MTGTTSGGVWSRVSGAGTRRAASWRWSLVLVAGLLSGGCVRGSALSQRKGTSPAQGPMQFAFHFFVKTRTGLKQIDVPPLSEAPPPSAEGAVEPVIASGPGSLPRNMKQLLAALKSRAESNTAPVPKSTGGAPSHSTSFQPSMRTQASPPSASSNPEQALGSSGLAFGVESRVATSREPSGAGGAGREAIVPAARLGFKMCPPRRRSSFPNRRRAPASR